MSEAKKPVVRVGKYNGVSTIFLNRPEKKNAMSPELHEAMDNTLVELEEDPDTKIVIIRGSGGNFSAGQDLKEFFRGMENNPRQAKRMAQTANRWRWERLYNYDKPTICVIEGYCVGAAGHRLRDRCRQRTVLARRSQLGDPAGRSGRQGRGGCGAVPPCAVPRLPR
jgi:feruloyl-CoA hydratase/lyase